MNASIQGNPFIEKGKKGEETGKKSFRCTFKGCQKSFKQAGNLRSHLRVHTGEKPFSCPFEQCARKFTALSSVKRHVHRYHNDQHKLIPMPFSKSIDLQGKSDTFQCCQFKVYLKEPPARPPPKLPRLNNLVSVLVFGPTTEPIPDLDFDYENVYDKDDEDDDEDDDDEGEELDMDLEVEMDVEEEKVDAKEIEKRVGKFREQYGNGGQENDSDVVTVDSDDGANPSHVREVMKSHKTYKKSKDNSCKKTKGNKQRTKKTGRVLSRSTSGENSSPGSDSSLLNDRFVNLIEAAYALSETRPRKMEINEIINRK